MKKASLMSAHFRKELMKLYCPVLSLLVVSILACVTLLGTRGNAASTSQSAKPLQIYFVDVEGGQAT
jgi:hypothetical protein